MFNNFSCTANLIERVSNFRYYKKSILAPEISDSVLQFCCFNLKSDWNFAQKFVNIVILEEGNIYPLEEGHIKEIIDLFKDEDIFAIKIDKSGSFSSLIDQSLKY